MKLYVYTIDFRNVFNETEVDCKENEKLYTTETSIPVRYITKIRKSEIGLIIHNCLILTESNKQLALDMFIENLKMKSDKLQSGIKSLSDSIQYLQQLKEK